MARADRFGTYSLLQVGDEVIAVLILLQTGKGHLRTRDVLSTFVAS